MELKDLKKGQTFKIADLADCPTITFSHTDGMYSYNTLENGDVINLNRFTPVELVKEIEG